MSEQIVRGEPTYILNAPADLSGPELERLVTLWDEAIRTGRPVILTPGWRVHDIAAGKTYEGYPTGWAEPQMALVSAPDRFNRGMLTGSCLTAFGGIVTAIVLRVLA